jgi:hypothetical protein
MLYRDISKPAEFLQHRYGLAPGDLLSPSQELYLSGMAMGVLEWCWIGNPPSSFEEHEFRTESRRLVVVGPWWRYGWVIL